MEKRHGFIAATELDVVERDEMHSYIGSKKACWIWIAVGRFGKRFLSVVVGSRDTDTGQCVREDAAHHDVSPDVTLSL